MADSKRDNDRARWSVAVTALLQHPTTSAAAKACGVSESTLRRWGRHPKFQAILRAARRQVIEGAIGRLAAAAGAASETLVRLMACGHPGTECRAAIAVLEAAMDAAAFADLEARVLEVEKEVNLKNGEAQA